MRYFERDLADGRQVHRGILMTILCLLFGFSTGWAQLELTLTSTENTNCNGSECDYEGPGILINELMLSPLVGDGSLWGGSSSQAGEWIELYNPNFCEPVDVSCYYLGNNANDGLAYPGGYVIPAGTVVPPAGFVLIRGVNAPAVPTDLLIENGGNTIELVVQNYGVCVGGGTRLWFPNAGGWFAFYDSNGVPQDAVTWANQSNQGQFPCVPSVSGCDAVAGLTNYTSIPDDRKAVILNVSAATYQGQSIRRIPDGGTWSGPSTPTYGTCNDVCIDPGTSTCNGTATVVASGGVEPYTFEWNDAQLQTTPTAVGLCGQEYCVVVTDNVGTTGQACILIEEPSYETTLEAGFCSGDSYVLPDLSVVTSGGEYTVMLQTAGGCDSLVTVTLEEFPSYEFIENVSICESGSYTLPDGVEVNLPGQYTVDYTTAAGCDSTYVINLSVEPVVDVPLDFAICSGEVLVLPDGSEVTEPGQYEVMVGGESCDTLYAITLVVNPVFNLSVDAAICENETYVLPDGQIISEGGNYETILFTTEGCDSIIQTNLLVNPLPVLNLPLQDAYCYQAGTIAINPSPPNGTLTGVLVNGTNLELGTAPPGNYIVNYAYTDVFGCSNTTSHTFEVLSAVNPSFAYNAQCFNTVDFTNLTENTEDISFSWLVNDTLFATGVSASYEYPVAGAYLFELVAVNSAGCTYSYSEMADLDEGTPLSAYWIPNVITPNGDSKNESLRVMPDDYNCLNYQIIVFNRWGKQVYEMTESSVPFMGKNSNGTALEDGTYFYILESPDIDCNNTMYKDLCRGSISVLR